MVRCPEDEPTAKNLVCKESSSYSRGKLEKPVGGWGGGGGGGIYPGHQRDKRLVCNFDYKPMSLVKN